MFVFRHRRFCWEVEGLVKTRMLGVLLLRSYCTWLDRTAEPTRPRSRRRMPLRKRAAKTPLADAPASKRAAQDEARATLSGGNKTLSKMAQFWREGKFCDVSIHVEGREFQAHRVVLAAGSEMLAAASRSWPGGGYIQDYMIPKNLRA